MLLFYDRCGKALNIFNAIIAIHYLELQTLIGNEEKTCEVYLSPNELLFWFLSLLYEEGSSDSDQRTFQIISSLFHRRIS